MNPSVPTFSSLTQLVDWNHADSPSAKCAYLVNAERPCKSRISRNICDQARSLLAEHLPLLTGISDGWDETYPRIKFLERLATLHLCHNHGQHDSHAVGQWLNELTADRDLIIAALKDYYEFEIDDTRDRANQDDRESGDNGTSDDEQDVSEEEYTSKEEEEYSSEEDLSEEEQAFAGQDMFGEKDASGAEHVRQEHEGRSAPSHQDSPPIQFLRRTRTLKEDEVAKEVTSLLEKPVRKDAKKPGWIYAICLDDRPGKVKVGFSFSPPHLQRLKTHKTCYPDCKLLAVQLIPYAYRVEQLLLTEFSNKHYRLGKACKKCKICHQEILDVDKVTLVSCLDKWIRFVESYPYNKAGNLKNEAKESLPLPALASYLGCKRTLRRMSGLTPKKKEENKRPDLLPPPSLGFKAPTLISKHVGSQVVEIDQDELSSAIEDLHLGLSRNKKRFL